MKKGAMLLFLLLGVSLGLAAPAADFDGDGTPDVAVFRPSSGLWAVREVTRLYFGTSGDTPVAGDYNGEGIDTAAVFRSGSGLWAVREVTRVYFGASTDQAVVGDYSGNGRNNFAVFRPSSGLWAVRNLTRIYFGSSTDIPVPAGRTARKGLLRTGQTSSEEDYDDGYYQAGLAFNYQTEAPNPGSPGQVVTLDKTTGLMWATYGDRAGCFNGQSQNWSDAVAWAENLNYAGYSDWRLPNVRELQSLIDYGKSDPAIRTRYFPNTILDYYWSSSSYATNTLYAWNLDFSNGYFAARDKISVYYVRAVRGGE